MSSKLERLHEANDPGLAELRRQLANVQPYQPAPGDPDYLTPAQTARILKDRQEDNDGAKTFQGATHGTRRHRAGHQRVGEHANAAGDRMPALRSTRRVSLRRTLGQKK